jgi:hypothetical protein
MRIGRDGYAWASSARCASAAGALLALMSALANKTAASVVGRRREFYKYLILFIIFYPQDEGSPRADAWANSILDCRGGSVDDMTLQYHDSAAGCFIAR